MNEPKKKRKNLTEFDKTMENKCSVLDDKFKQNQQQQSYSLQPQMFCRNLELQLKLINLLHILQRLKIYFGEGNI